MQYFLHKKIKYSMNIFCKVRVILCIYIEKHIHFHLEFTIYLQKCDRIIRHNISNL